MIYKMYEIYGGREGLVKEYLEGWEGMEEVFGKEMGEGFCGDGDFYYICKL